jgi:hypothetical protein
VSAWASPRLRGRLPPARASAGVRNPTPNTGLTGTRGPAWLPCSGPVRYAGHQQQPQPHDHRACLQPRRACTARARAPALAPAGGAAGARRSRLLPRPTTPRLTTELAPAAAAPAAAGPAAAPAAQQHRQQLAGSDQTASQQRPLGAVILASCGRPMPARSQSQNPPAHGAPDWRPDLGRAERPCTCPCRAQRAGTHACFTVSRYADTSGHTCQGASRAAGACGRRGAGRAGGPARSAAARGGSGAPAVGPAARECGRDLRERRAQLALGGGLLARGLRELGRLVVHVGEHLLQVGHLRRRLPRRARCGSRVGLTLPYPQHRLPHVGEHLLHVGHSPCCLPCRARCRGDGSG